MIFLTVGSQMPFDRLVRAVDQWAADKAAARAEDGPEVLAQVGATTTVFDHLKTVGAMTPAEFRAACDRAQVIVAHAGMGSVLTAFELATPIVLLPRRGDLQETRNDHQLATVRWLADKPGVYVAMTELEVGPQIEAALMDAKALSAIPPQASPELLGALDQFIRSAR